MNRISRQTLVMLRTCDNLGAKRDASSSGESSRLMPFEDLVSSNQVLGRSCRMLFTPEGLAGLSSPLDHQRPNGNRGEQGDQSKRGRRPIIEGRNKTSHGVGKLKVPFGTRLVVLLVLAICPVSVFGQGLTPDSYYPLTIGSEWTYRMEASLQGNTVELTADVRIVSKENAGTAECYMREYTIERKVDKQTARQTECYAWQGNKLLLYKGTIEGRFADPEPPQLQLDSPWEIGRRWYWSGTVGYEQCTLSGRVVKRASVDVPAGRFDAYEVELVLVTQGQSVTFSRWYADGVGLVKQTEVIPYDGASMYFSNELTSYSIAGGKSSGQGFTGSLLLDGLILAVVVVVAVLVIMRKRRSRACQLRTPNE